MKESFSLKEGTQLVKLARKSIAFYSATGSILKEVCPKKKFEKKRGVFTTLQLFPENRLRGCIGFPYPIKPLWNAVIESATAAAFEDPRFKPLNANELSKTIIELSILTQPKKLMEEKENIAKKLIQGKDGLIVKKGLQSGLLLPIVWIEYKQWSAEEFLQHTCLKAGLSPNAWKEKNTQIFTFQSQIFKETKPNGKIKEVKQKVK